MWRNSLIFQILIQIPTLKGFMGWLEKAQLFSEIDYKFSSELNIRPWAPLICVIDQLSYWYASVPWVASLNWRRKTNWATSGYIIIGLATTDHWVIDCFTAFLPLCATIYASWISICVARLPWLQEDFLLVISEDWVVWLGSRIRSRSGLADHD